MESVNPDPRRNDAEESNPIQISARTVQEAVEQGLRELALSEDQVEIEVIREGSRGIFGLGAEEALVQLTPRTTVKGSDAVIESDLSNEQHPSVLGAELKIEISEEASDETASAAQPTLDIDIDPKIQQRAKVILETLLQKMSVRAEVSFRVGHDLVDPGENPPLTLDITGSDLGMLIGRRGETLRSLQFVVRQILSKEAGYWIPLIIDVESYLVRRRKSLMQLAERMAEKVVASHRKITLEPMSGQERRIVHLQLRDHDEVYTQSIGEDERRKVVIYPKRP